MLEGELGRRDPDDHEPVLLVVVVPALDVGERALAVDARVGPEVDQHHLAAQLRCSVSGWLPGVLNQAVMPVKSGARPRAGRFVLLAMNTAGLLRRGAASRGGRGGRGRGAAGEVPALRVAGVGGGAGRLLALQAGVGGGELVLVLAAQLPELRAGRAGGLDVVLEGRRVAGHVALQRAQPVEGDGQGGDTEHDAGHPAHRGQVAAQGGPGGGRPLGHHGQHQEGDGDAERVEEGDEAATCAPTRWWAAATEMAVSTGPAQGTKTSPRLSPRTKPPPSVA